MGTAKKAPRDAEQDAVNDATRTASYEKAHGSAHSMPERLGRYEICEVLGAGAMGVVYRARDPELDRALAIKLVRGGGSTSSSGIRLLREAQAMARLRHPNVVPIFDVGPADNAVFVAMPLLEGGTLRSWLGDHARSLDAILDQFAAAGRGLAAAHAAGLVHRDFKPDNVLLGDGGEVLVADFGLARLVDADLTPREGASPLTSDALTETGTVLGTPAYMAPEQLRGMPIDARADQFSFCVSLWEALYGKRPFPNPRPGTDHPLRARLDAIAAGPSRPPARRGRPAWIAELLARGLSADPDRRWPSMEALLDAIAAHRTRRRRPWWLAAGLGAVGLAAAIFAFARPPRVQVGPPVSLVPLTHGGDFKRAAISPDGDMLALVAGDALVIRGIAPHAEDRVIVEHGVADAPIAWSPDGKHLLASLVPEIAPMTEAALVDIDRGVQFKLPVRGIATFLSSTEVAVTSYRQRTVAILPLGARATPTATCEVPGDYTFLWSLTGLPDGTMIVETLKDETHSLVILRRDCTVRANFAGEPISNVAASDTGTIVALVAGDGVGEIVEISLDGAILSRRRVSGDLDQIIGRRHGTDYVATLALKTHLARVDGGGPAQRVFSVNGGASFSLSPDRETLAWIDLGGRARGPLRLSTLQGISRRGQPVLDDAAMVGWSPDGQSLAVLVDDDAGPSIVVIDRNRPGSRRLPLRPLARAAAPVWLDDHRVAAQTDDRTTYRWFDLDTGEQGTVVDSQHGSTYWLARSPRDGMLAMWRNGAPGDAGAHDEHLWLKPVGQDARPLPVRDAIKYHLLPSWSPDGELLACALETGMVSRVALDTGALTPVAQVPPTPVSRLFDNHLMVLPDGDLLAVEIELGINVLEVRPQRDLRPRPGGIPDHL